MHVRVRELASPPPPAAAFPHRLSSARVVRALGTSWLSYLREFRKEGADKSRGNSAQSLPLPPDSPRRTRLAAPFGHRGRCEDTEKSDLADYPLARRSREYSAFKIQSARGGTYFSKTPFAAPRVALTLSIRRDLSLRLFYNSAHVSKTRANEAEEISLFLFEQDTRLLDRTLFY